MVVPYSGNPHTNGLIAAWNFFESAGLRVHDLIGQNHGTVVGTTPVWTIGSPNEGSVMKFSGDNSADRINIGSMAAGNPLMLTATDFTIMARVRPRGPYGSTFPRILDKSDSGNAANGYAFYHRTDRLVLAMAGTEQTSAGSSLVQANLENAWSVSGVTFRDGDNETRFYSNHFVSGGTLIQARTRMRLLTAITATTQPATTTTNMALGNWNHTIDREWAGDISWIYIWDRVLSLDEVSEVALTPHALFQPYKTRIYIPNRVALTPPVGDGAALGDQQITIIAG